MPPLKPLRHRGRPRGASVPRVSTDIAFCREVQSLVRQALIREGYLLPSLAPFEVPYSTRPVSSLATHRGLADLSLLLTWFSDGYLRQRHIQDAAPMFILGSKQQTAAGIAIPYIQNDGKPP